MPTARSGGGAAVAAEADEAADAPRSAATEPGRLEPAALSPEESARIARQLRLEAQREAQKLCERQYGEASRACRQTLELVAARPAEARAQAESLTRALVDKMVDAREICIRVLAEGVGDKASMHAMNVGIISLLMGRCFGFSAEEIAGPRRRRDAARHRQARAAAAPAPPRGQLLAERAARLPGARRDRPGPGEADGPLGRGDGGDRPAPRACRRQRLSGRPQQRPDDDGGADRRPRQPLRQPLQSAPAGPGADAARGAVAAVRPGPQQVRHLDPRRLHQDDGRLPAGLDGAAHRRPLRARWSPSTRRGR